MKAQPKHDCKECRLCTCSNRSSNVSPVFITGLHARPAVFFIQKANEFKSSIWVEVEDRKINAKSLLGVLSMGITKGTRVSIIAEGPDEEEAVKALTEMLVKEIF